MKVEIFHNISRDASFGLNGIFEKPVDGDPRKYTKRQARTTDEQHELVKVFEYDAPETYDAYTAAEEAFERFNVGENDLAKAYRARLLRSLSVGDVLVFEDGDALSVEPLGFEVRQPAELRIVTDPAEAEKLIRERYDFRPAEQLTVTVPWSA